MLRRLTVFLSALSNILPAGQEVNLPLQDPPPPESALVRPTLEWCLILGLLNTRDLDVLERGPPVEGYKDDERTGTPLL